MYISVYAISHLEISLVGSYYVFLVTTYYIWICKESLTCQFGISCLVMVMIRLLLRYEVCKQ